MDYPSDEALEKIEQWPVSGTADLRALFDFVRTLWLWPDWGWIEKGSRFDISTGGWSGNEDIIDALEKNFMFWSLCWVQSRRGGHYQFELREIGK